MRWFLLPLMLALALSGAGAVPASAAQSAPEQVAPPSGVVLVERLTTDGALEAVGPGRAEVTGFISALPVHQPLASRVLSLAAGRRVDAMDALEADPAAASGLPGPTTVERIRADNPGARFGRLPSTRVLTAPGLEVAGLFALGASGPAPAPGSLGQGAEPLRLREGQLLVLAVPDDRALKDLVGRLRWEQGAGPVLVVGLRAAPGLANTAPLLVLEQPGARGLVTSDSTRRLGLVALEDVRPTIGGPSDGDDGTRIRLAADPDPAAAATRVDRRVTALVAARTWAIPLLCLAAVLALFALVGTWRARGDPGRPAAAARTLLALTLALPSGYLLASMAEPVAAEAWRALDPGALRDPGVAGPWAVTWVASGVAVAAALTALALRLDRPTRAGTRPRPAAPALLGAVLLALVVLDLVLGGHGLSQPLVGGSAWDGERFYGLGNGYFAFALASVMLVAAFAPLAAVATAALLVGLGIVDGLPRLGADVGGALTSMLTAAAALVVLAPGRPGARRVVLLGGLAVAAAVAVALGAGLGGPVSHAGRFAERLQQGPADAVGVVVDQLARNLRLLANSPFAWAGPLQVLLAGLIALRPPPPLDQLPGWIRRVLGLGAFGSALLILLNDTGVTATSASGLFLLAIPAWAWLDQHRRAGPPSSRPRARPAEVRH
jgi:hypothetical protein